MVEITMKVTAASGGTEYLEGETYSVSNTLAAHFIAAGYVEGDADEEAGVTAVADSDSGTATDEGAIG